MADAQATCQGTEMRGAMSYLCPDAVETRLSETKWILSRAYFLAWDMARIQSDFAKELFRWAGAFQCNVLEKLPDEYRDLYNALVTAAQQANKIGKVHEKAAEQILGLEGPLAGAYRRKGPYQEAEVTSIIKREREDQQKMDSGAVKKYTTSIDAYLQLIWKLNRAGEEVERQQRKLEEERAEHERKKVKHRDNPHKSHRIRELRDRVVQREGRLDMAVGIFQSHAKKEATERKAVTMVEQNYRSEFLRRETTCLIRLKNHVYRCLDVVVSPYSVSKNPSLDPAVYKKEYAKTEIESLAKAACEAKRIFFPAAFGLNGLKGSTRSAASAKSQDKPASNSSLGTEDEHVETSGSMSVLGAHAEGKISDTSQDIGVWDETPVVSIRTPKRTHWDHVVLTDVDTD